MAGKYKAPQLRPHFIKPWLDALGVSQAELARRMDIERNNVTRWIDEPWRVGLDILSGVADALEMGSAAALLEPPPSGEPDKAWSSMTEEERIRAIRLFKAAKQ